MGDNEGEEEEEGWSRRVGVEKRGCEIGELREHAAAPKDDLLGGNRKFVNVKFSKTKNEHNTRSESAKILRSCGDSLRTVIRHHLK